MRLIYQQLNRRVDSSLMPQTGARGESPGQLYRAVEWITARS
ncbi:hypothetical protein [Pseudomonas sp. TMW22090]|nr:hypothetical protein [Pseudomonas sp. TMW22090]